MALSTRCGALWMRLWTTRVGAGRAREARRSLALGFGAAGGDEHPLP